MELFGILLFILSIAATFTSERKKKDEEARARQEKSLFQEKTPQRKPKKTQSRLETLAQYIEEMASTDDNSQQDSKGKRNEGKSQRRNLKNPKANRQAKGVNQHSQNQNMALEDGRFEDSAALNESNDGYFSAEIDQNERDLNKALKQMDDMYDERARELNQEIDALFDAMDDEYQPLRPAVTSKKKTISAREKLGLQNQTDLKRGILLKEILDSPVAKRHQA